MQIAPEVREVEDLARIAKVPLSKALRRAGVASTTYWRWVNAGSEPSTKTIRKIKTAIHELGVEAA